MMTNVDITDNSRRECFVVAFRGRRDDYQLPLALHEFDHLETLITDYYASESVESLPLPAFLKKKLLLRHNPGLPASRVCSLWARAAAEKVLVRLGWSETDVLDEFDKQYDMLAAREALRRRAGLFLYAPYAYDAFARSYPHDPTKLLFQYHPHYAVEAALLAKDAERSRELGLVFGTALENTATVQRPARLRADNAWRHAHHVVCASEFTRQSLLEAGADPRRVSVVSYGVPQLPEREVRAVTPMPLHVLFVGTGAQRKGLHHLLLAWRRAELPVGATLTVVCRVIDPAIEPLFNDLPSATLLRGVSKERLDSLYRTATLFCMPSLVEGFGQVYLEALSAGLPVLGTTNTCLPDLGGEDDGIFTTRPGDPDRLAAQLERLASDPQVIADLKHPARLLASTFTWERFRRKVSTIAEEQSELRWRSPAGRLSTQDAKQAQVNEDSLDIT